ncbi:hypothetical protein DL96DRAFT_720917 [Flagelloscypha sp. PMI_526]|nr:hypothetical protein DL96DRAFT_720917 [Flagelloscypha sp. PMI_526]
MAIEMKARHNNHKHSRKLAIANAQRRQVGNAIGGGNTTPSTPTSTPQAGNGGGAPTTNNNNAAATTTPDSGGGGIGKHFTHVDSTTEVIAEPTTAETTAAAEPTTTSSSTTSSASAPIATTSSSAPVVISTAPVVVSIAPATTFKQSNPSRTLTATLSTDEPASTSASPDQSGGAGTSAVIGGVAGGLLGFVALCIALVYGLKYYRRKKEIEEALAFDASEFRSSAVILPDDPRFDTPSPHSGAGGGQNLHPNYSFAPSAYPPPQQQQPPNMSQLHALPVSQQQHMSADFTGYGTAFYNPQPQQPPQGYAMSPPSSSHGSSKSFSVDPHNASDELRPPRSLEPPGHRPRTLSVEGGEVTILAASPNSPTSLSNPFAAAEYVPPAVTSPPARDLYLPDPSHPMNPNSNSGYFDMNRESTGTVDSNAGVVGGNNHFSVVNGNVPMSPAHDESSKSASRGSPLGIREDESIYSKSKPIDDDRKSVMTTVYDPEDAYGGM